MPSTGELVGKVVFLAGAGLQMGSASARIAAREGAKIEATEKADGRQ